MGTCGPGLIVALFAGGCKQGKGRAIHRKVWENGRMGQVGGRHGGGGWVSPPLTR